MLAISCGIRFDGGDSGDMACCVDSGDGGDVVCRVDGGDSGDVAECVDGAVIAVVVVGTWQGWGKLTSPPWFGPMGIDWCTSQSPRQSLWSPWDTWNPRINTWTPWTSYKIHKLQK